MSDKLVFGDIEISINEKGCMIIKDMVSGEKVFVSSYEAIWLIPHLECFGQSGVKNSKRGYS